LYTRPGQSTDDEMFSNGEQTHRVEVRGRSLVHVRAIWLASLLILWVTST
jgi:hypothetical protein